MQASETGIFITPCEKKSSLPGEGAPMSVRRILVIAVVLMLIIPLGLIASDYDILALVTHGAAAMPYPFAVLLCCPATSLAALFLILERNSVTISVVIRTVLLYLLGQLLAFVIALVAYTYTERFWGQGSGLSGASVALVLLSLIVLGAIAILSKSAPAGNRG